MYINHKYCEPTGHVEIQEITILVDQDGNDYPSYHRFVISPHDVERLDAACGQHAKDNPGEVDAPGMNFLTKKAAQICKNKWSKL